LDANPNEERRRKSLGLGRPSPNDGQEHHDKAKRRLYKVDPTNAALDESKDSQVGNSCYFLIIP
jgi:hypothetical protein